VELALQRHVLSKEALEHLLEPGHDGVQVHHLRFHGLAAGEGEELLGKRRRLLAGFLDAGEVPAQERVVPVAVEQEVRVAEDREQAVVEVVRDARRKPTDRLHLLRVEELALEHLVLGLVALPLGDVADGDHGHVLALEHVLLAGYLDVHRGAVPLPADTLPGHAVELGLVFRDEVREPAPEDLFRRAVEDRDQRVVDFQDGPVPDNGDPLESGLEQGAEALLASPDLLLGRLALGDFLLGLLVEADVLHHRSDLVGHRRDQVDVGRGIVVVRVPAADQPDTDGPSLEDQWDHQPDPGESAFRLLLGSQVASLLREHRPELVERGLSLFSGHSLLTERFLLLFLEQVEGRLPNQQRRQDILGDHLRQDLPVKGCGDAVRDDGDDLLRSVLDAEHIAVDDRLKATAQERSAGDESQREEQDGGKVALVDGGPAPADGEQGHHVRGDVKS
jgi:hypothetical protein